MKILSIILFTIVFLTKQSYTQNIGIGTITPNASAALEIKDTTRGLLPPRMTYEQRNAINNPASGLIVFCTDCSTNGEMQYFNGVNWISMGTSLASVPSNLFVNIPSVTICNQTWATKNLDVSTYRNGDVIPKITDPSIWMSLTTGAYCYYNNDSATYASTYGKLYNWYAVNDPRGLAPNGWHIPTNSEWNKLIKCIDGSSDTTCICLQSSFAGGALKEVGVSHWIAPNTGATNSTNFLALPAGTRSNNGSFNVIGNDGYWWTSTEESSNNAYYKVLYYNTGGFYNQVSSSKVYAFSIRCIKN